MSLKTDIKIKILDHYDKGLNLPYYTTKEAAGADIRACLGVGEKLILAPGQKKLIPTGLSMEIPKGFEIQVRPRSGLSFKTGLMVLNSPGTIDSDYRGEVKVILGNLGQNEEIISHGDRIAQIVVAPVIQGNFILSDSLDESERGAGGFGSTGVS